MRRIGIALVTLVVLLSWCGVLLLMSLRVIDPEAWAARDLHMDDWPLPDNGLPAERPRATPEFRPHAAQEQTVRG